VERVVRVQSIRRSDGREQYFITLPSEVARALGVGRGSEVRISVSGTRVVLEPVSRGSGVEWEYRIGKYTVRFSGRVGGDGVASRIQLTVLDEEGGRKWVVTVTRTRDSENSWVTVLERIEGGVPVVSVTISEMIDRLHSIREPRSVLRLERILEVKSGGDAAKYIYDLLLPYIGEAYRVEFPRELLYYAPAGGSTSDE
jgi:bifunctional DNA-binding transcriptional regulator/antitoxin component of YhaV-PrlF toxin-antitoxin module